jgi:hypothetical protein
MSEQLEPCLMCGSEDIVFDGVSVSFYCHECGHYGPINFGNKMEAAALWNRSSKRAYAPQEEIAALRASRDALAEALEGLLPQTFTGNPSRAELVAHWERERDLGNGNAPFVLAAYAALADHAKKGEAS